LKGGIFNYYVGLTELQLSENEDYRFLNDYKKNFQPNIGSGAHLYADNFFLGISVPKLIKTELEKVNSNDSYESEVKRHMFLSGGYLHTLTPEWKIKALALSRLTEGAPVSTDVTGLVSYQDKFFFGASYRIGDALAAMFQLKANNQFTIGYSYDITLTRLSRINTGSHEILLSYDFSGFRNSKVRSPRHF
ncbi:MAG: type IX secretion system membrane protein PorP/SprF, partial [Bacteroidales bacterium]|nr:type IX secretion system membrane protein PorP/SprF [Bacteroidales bacterium]